MWVLLAVRFPQQSGLINPKFRVSRPQTTWNLANVIVIGLDPPNQSRQIWVESLTSFHVLSNFSFYFLHTIQKFCPCHSLLYLEDCAKLGVNNHGPGQNI